jgi:uncharacterized SAM-binding protein YcdF (DUF218 family)
MFFVLSKILGVLVLPSNLLIIVGVLGLALTATRWSRAGQRLMAVSIVLLAIAGLSPLGNALIMPLEDRFPPWDDTHGPPFGIVVLGGAIDEVAASRRPNSELNEAAERMTAAVALALRFPQARIVFTGGTSRLAPDGTNEADVAVRLLERLGVPADRIIAEYHSRTTEENAAFTKGLVRPEPNQRWLLVTSAHHMPRAMGAFRQAQFKVEAYPVDWRTRGPVDLVRPFSTLGDGLRRTDTAMREWIGLFAYWLTGRTLELFPGP